MRYVVCGKIIALFIAVMVFVHPAQAAINNTVQFQGKVTNSDGTNVGDGTYDFVFKIYNGAGSGASTLFTESWTSSALWSSTMSSAPGAGGESLTYSTNTNESTIAVGQILWNTTKGEAVVVTSIDTGTNVVGISPTRQAWAGSDTVTNKIYVKDGVFTVALNGLNNNWGTVNFGNDNLFVGLEFNGNGEMKPRIQFKSVPYAQQASAVTGLSVVSGKTLTVSNSLTFQGTDGTTFTFPTATGTVATLDATQELTNKTIGSTGLTFSGATTDITTVSNQNLAIVPNGTGNVGIGTTTVNAQLSVQDSNGSQNILPIFRLERFNTAGAGGTGLGGGIDYYLENANSTLIKAGGVNVVLDTATGGAENAYINFDTVINGTVGTNFSIGQNNMATNISGAFMFNAYSRGSGDKYWSTGASHEIWQNGTNLEFNYAPSGTQGSAVNYSTGIVLNANAGNIGIGTTDPQYKLQVAGNTKIGNGSLLFLGTNSGAPTGGANGSMYFDTGAGKFKCYQGGWTDCIGSGGTPSWSTITDPSTSLTLSMQTNLTTFNWINGTGTNNLFNLETDPTADGTGYIFNIKMGSGSTVNPFRIAYDTSNMFVVNADGRTAVGSTINTTHQFAISSATTEMLSLRNINSQLGNGDNIGLLDIGASSSPNQARVLVTRGASGAGASDMPTDISLWNIDDGSGTLTERMRIKYNGNVGINTTDPGARLAVDSGTSGVSGLRFTQLTSASTSVTGNGKVLGLNSSGDVIYVDDAMGSGSVPDGTANGDTLRWNGSAWAANNVIYNNGTNVGIGTSTVLEKFNVSGNATVSGNITMGGQMQVGRKSGDPTDLVGNGAMYYNTTTNTFRCYQNGAWTNCIKGDSIDVIKTSDQNVPSGTALTSDTALSFPIKNGESWLFKFDIIATNINNATPDWKAAILGASGWTCNVTQSGSEGAGAVWPQAYTTDCDNAPGTLVNAAVRADASASFNVTIQGIITASSNGTVQLQWGPNTSGSLTVRTASFVHAQKVGGADLAEVYYTKEDDLYPGTVVSVDGRLHAGVKKSTRPYDTTLMGVVSTKPGLLLGGSDGQSDGGSVLLALSGRVPVKVSAENGPVLPGDYLTSSSIPGVAMKATRAGPTIGMAMSGYDGEGTGTVIVFIKNGFSLGEMNEENEIATLDTESTPSAVITPQEYRVRTPSWFEEVVTMMKDAVFHGRVTFMGKVLFGPDSGGEAVIRAGATEVVVRFDDPYDTAPLISANYVLNENDETAATESGILSGDVKYIITKRSKNGFTIKINEPRPYDVVFTWNAVWVRDKKTSIGETRISVTPMQPTPEVSPTQTPSPTPTVTEAEVTEPSPP